MDRSSWRKEPVVAVLAFIAAFLTIVLLGTVIAAGTGIAAPRAAALFLVAPAGLIAAICARHKPTRRFFLLWWG